MSDVKLSVYGKYEDAVKERDTLRVEVGKLREALNAILFMLQERISTLESDNTTLRNALERSVVLQSHYAELLNMHDGGQRLVFLNVDSWLERLAELRSQAKEP